jgi:hypothetical protein
MPNKAWAGAPTLSFPPKRGAMRAQRFSWELTLMKIIISGRFLNYSHENKFSWQDLHHPHKKDQFHECAFSTLKKIHSPHEISSFR